MEVVVIDKATFERMLSEFEKFAGKVERLCREHKDLREREWLDSDDVCRLLGISPRTCRRCGKTEHWLIPRLATRCITDRRM